MPYSASGVRARRGFSLIEAAIVLGIIGLVIGGVWAASAYVSERARWKDTAEGWAQIMSNVMGVYTAGVISGSEDIPAFLESGMQHPAGWVGRRNDPGNGLTFRLVDPYGYGVSAATAIFGDTPSVIIGYFSPMYFGAGGVLPVNHCARMYKLLNDISTQYRIVRWDGVPGGCNPSTAMTVVDYANSTCCPGNPIAWFAAP